MNQEFTLMIQAAFAVGIVHTLLGPDHYVPFIALAKSRRWTLAKTIGVTLLCGLAHIAGAVVLGLGIVGLGLSLQRFGVIESVRGGVAAWALMAFGVAYMVWGARRVFQKREAEVKIEDRANSPVFWFMFLIFLFGPCEPLIPLMTHPLCWSEPARLFIIVGVFGLSTLAAMTVAVTVSVCGLNVLGLGRVARFSHVLAGGAIVLCGAAIRFLGL
ncbi:MAG: hypothetical protein Q8Q08_10405 [Candidatus Omnitrophota bacterium]|nr:hypothetical protein [Candidatus Omnitrophota bacterium]MDZ4242879.1 hypothetical protein [Candidatus Omnitrophota bacterium]